MTEKITAIDALSYEQRKFPPSIEFKVAALVSDQRLYEEGELDSEAFWARHARELISWVTPFTKTLEWDLPYSEWFPDGTLNVSYNCLDRHVLAGRGDKVAFYWEGEPGDARTITYSQLLEEVQKFSNVLKDLGITKGDCVNIYLPMIPEAAVAMLACARIGAVHSVVFGGFSAQSLSDRINDAQAKLLITSDGGWRRGEVFPLKSQADEALKTTTTIQHVVVVRRGNNEITMTQGRDVWYHEAMASADPICDAEPMEAEHLLFLLYT